MTDTGVDYLVVTSLHSDDKLVMSSIWKKVKAEQEALGNIPYSVKMAGFCGDAVAGMSLMDRIEIDTVEDERVFIPTEREKALGFTETVSFLKEVKKTRSMLTLIGEAARDRYHELRMGIGLRAANVSRIDLQATLLFEREARVAKSLAILADGKDMWHKYIKGQGDTCYVGKGDVVMRVYDKGEQLKAVHKANHNIPANTLWRIEVQLKGDSANDAFLQLSQDKKTTWDVISGVSKNKGLLLPNSYIGKVIDVGKKLSDRDKTLAWFKSSVKPSVGRLLESCPSEVLESLGLGEVEHKVSFPLVRVIVSKFGSAAAYDIVKMAYGEEAAKEAVDKAALSLII